MPEINRNALTAFRNAQLGGDQLKGKALDDAAKLKPVDNDVSVINFFAKDGMGNVVPFLNADPSPVEDPGKKDKIITADGPTLERLKGKPEEFVKLFEKAVADNKAYLSPTRDQVEGAPTQFKYNAIVGMRVDQLHTEATKLANELYGRDPAKLDQALYAVNTACFDLNSRELVFDDFEISGYASFGHDAAFIHAWETRLEQLNAVDERLLTPSAKAELKREKEQIQGELDAIFRSKYVYNNSSMFEVDAEKSVGLCLIDKDSRQRVSESLDSLKTIVPKFEIINVQHGGEDRAVFYDAAEKSYFFDKSSEPVPAELAAKIDAVRKGDAQHGDVSVESVSPQSCTFRRAVSGEQLRKNFRFDWNGDGYVQKAKIDWTSWAGHCDVKAQLEIHGLVVPRGHAGVYEYDSLTGSTAHYNRDLLNEISMSLGEMGSTMVDSRGRRSTVANEDYKFAGARDDDRPDRIVLGNGRNIPYQDRPNKFDIKKIVTADKEYSAAEAFREHIVAEDGRSAEKNPLFEGMVDGDRVQLGLGNAAIHADVTFQVFDDESGYPSTKSAEVVLDFANPSDEPVMVDSVMDDPAKRTMWEISVDTKNKQWIAQKVQMVPKEDGARGFDKKEVGEPIKDRFDPKDMMGQRETSLDNPKVYMPFVKEALQSAKNFTSETADGAGVWNGRTKSLKQATVWRDDETKWAKVSIDVDARYGGNSGEFLVKLKDDGNPDFYVPLKMPFDFVWRTDAAMAPVLDGRVNEKAKERGVVSRVDGRFTAEAVDNLLEILHCGFNERRYVVKHEGERYFFDSKEEWEAAKAHLDGLRGAIFEAGEPEPGGEVVMGTVLDVKGADVGRKELVPHQIVAEADGDVTIRLDTNSGDADLYVSRNGAPATEDDHQLKSWNSGTSPDEIVLEGVKKGEVINIGVHGYKGSNYDLKVTAPTIGGEPAPEPQKIDVELSGVVKRNETMNLPTYPIVIEQDGVLDLTMFGSGDADVYVGVNKDPGADGRDADLRMEDWSSNERGTLKVKAGDEVFVKVFGYAASSEFDLRVKSQ